MKKKTPFSDLPDNRALKIASDLRMRIPEIDVELQARPQRNRLIIRQEPNLIDQFILKQLIDYCNRRGFNYSVFAFPVVPVVNYQSVNLTFEIF